MVCIFNFFRLTALAKENPSTMVCEIAADERPTVPGLLAEIEEEITELPLRMTVRTLCSLSKNCESEMRRVYGRDEVSRHYATVFFETRRMVRAMASANWAAV